MQGNALVRGKLLKEAVEVLAVRLRDHRCTVGGLNCIGVARTHNALGAYNVDHILNHTLRGSTGGIAQHPARELYARRRALHGEAHVGEGHIRIERAAPIAAEGVVARTKEGRAAIAPVGQQPVEQRRIRGGARTGRAAVKVNQIDEVAAEGGVHESDQRHAQCARSVQQRSYAGHIGAGARRQHLPRKADDK